MSDQVSSTNQTTKWFELNSHSYSVEMKLITVQTLSRSRGCVQQAAPALANPPWYHLATIFVFGFDSSAAMVVYLKGRNMNKEGQ